ncbi:MAG: DUF3108 domain-containing protein [Arenicella sp.]
MLRTQFSPLRYLTVSAIILFTALPTFADTENQQIKLNYSVIWNGSNLGQIETNITQEEDRFEIASVTKAEGMASIWLGGNLLQKCSFQTRDSMIFSNEFHSTKKGKAGYSNTINYDWKSQKITFNDDPAFDMPKGYIVDNCNFHFAAAYTAINKLKENSIYVMDGKKKRIRGYVFKSISEEQLTTPIGDFDTTKIVLERELDPNKTFTFWISPDKPYFPLKMMDQRKSGQRIMLIQNLNPSS